MSRVIWLFFTPLLLGAMTARIEILVVDGYGNKISQAGLKITNERDGSVIKPGASTGGVWVAHLDPGPYTVEARAASFWTEKRAVRVRGQDQRVTLGLSPSTMLDIPLARASVTLNLMPAPRQSVRWARLMGVYLNWRQETVASGGKLVFRDVPGGLFVLAACSENAHCASGVVEVFDDSREPVEIPVHLGASQ